MRLCSGVQNDILCVIDSNHSAILVLYLSAAFDTVDHAFYSVIYIIRPIWSQWYGPRLVRVLPKIS